MQKIPLVFLLLVLVVEGQSQVDSTVQPALPADSMVAKPATVHSYFALSLGFLNNSVYNGRKDTVAIPYISPSIGYYHKSGLFMDASLSYLARSGSSRVDLFTIEAGYDFNLGNFDGELAANKSFYNSSSTNVSSEISATVFFNGGYDFFYVKPTIEAGVNIGTRTDYLLGYGLEHTFYMLKDKLFFTPGITGHGSTQNYYGVYYNKRKVGRKRKNAGVVYDITTVVEDASQFKMLDYELSLPISYQLKKWTMSLSPVYVVPLNPAQITTTLVPENGGITKIRTATETISNSFYCSVGLSYRF
jgi:hypothetical protein